MQPMETIVSTPTVPGAGGTRGESQPVAATGCWPTATRAGLVDRGRRYERSRRMRVGGGREPSSGAGHAQAGDLKRGPRANEASEALEARWGSRPPAAHRDGRAADVRGQFLGVRSLMQYFELTERLAG